jgi:hypothetical protein
MKKSVNPFKPEPEGKSLDQLANQAWKLMSIWVRRNESDANGYCYCVDGCGHYGPWQEFDAGHFVHAGNGGKRNPVSYDIRNIHPQKPTCNRQSTSKHRHPGIVTQRYTEFMVKRYGLGITDQLEAIKKQPWFRHKELEEQIELLKSKIKVLDKSKLWVKAS